MDKEFNTLKKFSHKVGLNLWHIEFATKYRYKMFSKEERQKLVEACIRKVAHKFQITIRLITVLPEHVHMLVTFPHGMTESRALMLLKGGSAYHFFRNHPKSRLRLPRGSLWSAGGCAITVGYNELSTVENYIKNQVEHHASA